MKTKLIAPAIAAAALVAAGLYYWAYQPAIAPAAPAPVADAADIAQGARIVALGDCMVCHTSGNGASHTISSWAQTEAAFTAGALLLMPATPMGQTIAAMRSAGKPRACRRCSNCMRLVFEPIRPNQPTR